MGGHVLITCVSMKCTDARGKSISLASICYTKADPKNSVWWTSVDQELKHWCVRKAIYP